MKEIVKKLSLR